MRSLFQETDYTQLTLPPTGQPYWKKIEKFHNSCRLKFTARRLPKWCKDLLLSQHFEWNTSKWYQCYCFWIKVKNDTQNYEFEYILWFYNYLCLSIFMMWSFLWNINTDCPPRKKTAHLSMANYYNRVFEWSDYLW